MANKVKIRGPYDLKRVKTVCDSETLTKQSMRDETDINRIVQQYSRTGLLSHLMSLEPTYADVSGNDFMESMLLVRQAQEAFDELPAELRARFSNDPAMFLDFVGDPRNDEEAVRLGLKKFPEKESPQKVEVVNSPATPPTTRRLSTLKGR